MLWEIILHVDMKKLPPEKSLLRADPHLLCRQTVTLQVLLSDTGSCSLQRCVCVVYVCLLECVLKRAYSTWKNSQEDIKEHGYLNKQMPSLRHRCSSPLNILQAGVQQSLDQNKLLSPASEYQN